MDAVISVVMKINEFVWSLPLVLLCLGAGLWFTISLKGCQFRLFGDMIRLIRSKSEAERGEGISAFQSFATTVGFRVGMGNITGVATALFLLPLRSVRWHRPIKRKREKNTAEAHRYLLRRDCASNP